MLAQQPPDANPQAVAEVLRALLTTASWDETRAVLEREQVLLLSQTVERLVTARLAQAVQENNQRVSSLASKSSDAAAACP
jgi:hypothetical protein